MSKYLMRYKGTYRVMSPIDLSTNDFPRDIEGRIETDDLYIPCKNGSMIYHYGHSILEAYISTTNKAKHLIDLCNEQGIKLERIKYGDGECYIRFNAKYIDPIAKYLGAKVIGKDISPMSVRNLPKSDYSIPPEDLATYKDIANRKASGDTLVISRVTEEFLFVKLQKKYKQDIKADMKKKCMFRQHKEYIHSIGEWDNFIKYLHKNLDQYGSKEKV